MTQTDLQPFINDLAKLPKATALARESGLRTMLLHLKAGEQIPEHQTRGAITVHCLQGQASFVSGEERAELRPASLVSLAPDVPHSVVAQQETLLLVTMSEAILSESVKA
jgi:quercetin dioxygenase-like cupin family protein